LIEEGLSCSGYENKPSLPSRQSISKGVLKKQFIIYFDEGNVYKKGSSVSCPRFMSKSKISRRRSIV